MNWNAAGTEWDKATMKHDKKQMPKGDLEVGWSLWPTVKTRWFLKDDFELAVRGLVVAVPVTESDKPE